MVVNLSSPALPASSRRGSARSLRGRISAHALAFVVLGGLLSCGSWPAPTYPDGDVPLSAVEIVEYHARTAAEIRLRVLADAKERVVRFRAAHPRLATVAELAAAWGDDDVLESRLDPQKQVFDVAVGDEDFKDAFDRLGLDATKPPDRVFVDGFLLGMDRFTGARR